MDGMAAEQEGLGIWYYHGIRELDNSLDLNCKLCTPLFLNQCDREH
jgi:hypothetical protein